MATENYRCSRHSMNLLHLAVGLIQGSSGECAGSEIRGRTPWRPRGPGCWLHPLGLLICLQRRKLWSKRVYRSSVGCTEAFAGALVVCRGLAVATLCDLCPHLLPASLGPCVANLALQDLLPDNCCLSQKRSPWNQGQPAVTCLLLLPHQNHPGSKLADSLGVLRASGSSGRV